MKRVFSFVLCMVMLFSLLPLQAQAAETDSADLIQQYTKAAGAMSADLDYSEYPSVFQSGKETRDVGDRSYRESEPNDSFATANRLYSDYTVSGTLSGTDFDYFGIYISSPSRVTIIAAASYSSYAIGVHDSTGDLIGANVDGDYYKGSYMYELYGTLVGGTYYISMLDADGRYNSYTFYILVEPIKLTAPTLKASTRASDGKISLSWNAIAGAKEYKVYRATSEKGEYKLVKTTTDTSFTNTSVKAGTKYYYKVKAIHNSKSSCNSSYSKVVSIYCDLPKPEAKATVLSSSGSIKISWEKIDGAKEYKVYRATSEDGDYTLMKTTSKTSYTNSSAKAGITYYYKVKAIHSKSSANSVYSAVVSATGKLGKPDVTATNIASSGKIKLSWDAQSDALEYHVYRATEDSGEYELVHTTIDTTYTDPNTEVGAKYYYKVQAVHSDATYDSLFSEVDTRTHDLPRPVVSIALKKGDPRLTWEAVEGAEEYQIYRATSKNGEYKLVKTTTGTAYTNTSVKAGKTYYYKVKAIHSNSSANSAYSSVDSIKAK